MMICLGMPSPSPMDTRCNNVKLNVPDDIQDYHNREIVKIELREWGQNRLRSFATPIRV